MRLAWIVAVMLLSGCQRILATAVGAQLVEPQAVRALGAPEIIDIREPAEYLSGHLPGAINVPILELDGFLSRAHATRAQPLVLVCAAGVNAALAVPTARLYGREPVVLAGGMVAWSRAGLEVAVGPSPSPDVERMIPVRPFTRFQQTVASASGCVIKPIYLLLSLVLIRVLRRATAAPLRLLRHGMLCFFVGEMLCAANFFFHRPGLWFPIEILHGLGMVAMSAFVPWGFWRLLDERVLHFTAPGQGCMLQRFCGQCWKRDPVRCGVHDLMFPLLVGLAALALMPLSAPLRPTMFRTEIFGSVADYGEPIVNHLVELRLYPIVGALLFLGTLFFLLRGGTGSVRRVEPVFYAALGFTLYPMFRHLLANAYRESLYWSDFWEELTELLTVTAVGAVLVLFRRQLGLFRAGNPAPPAESTPSG